MSPEMTTGNATDPITISLDGREVTALTGQSVAAALEAAGIRSWRTNAVDSTARAPFCGMGVCYECELHVEGSAETRACMTEVEPGLRMHSEMVTRTNTGMDTGMDTGTESDERLGLR
jgi:predicted molibdopterin-dependent oxidoreductase YjgC